MSGYDDGETVMAAAHTTPGHRMINQIVGVQAWQPIDGAGSAQRSLSCSTGLHSMVVPITAHGLIITANQNVSLSLRSTFAPTASQGYLLPSMTPSPALVVPRHGDLSTGKSVVRFRAVSVTGRINFLFLEGRGS